MSVHEYMVVIYAYNSKNVFSSIPGVLSPLLDLHFNTRLMFCFVLWQQNVKLTTTCWSA